ncbi:MAG: GntR family transcriptional regulator [Lachnospiraceae bacterium]|nr:GntR family transcriptional regulator [Lachnospiraceae bacterium]
MKNKSLLQLQAYDAIKSRILTGELEPEQLYSETKLSAEIGVSRTPMREALQCLSQDGYITIIPSKGFMIRQLNAKDMRDSIQIRCAIEGFCTKVIASELGTERCQELIRSLGEMLEQMERALSQEDMESFIHYDHQFHLLLVNYLHNDEFNHIFQRLLYLIQLTSKSALAVEGRTEDTIEEHREYYEALCSGDGPRAYELIINHLMMPLQLQPV